VRTDPSDGLVELVGFHEDRTDCAGSADEGRGAPAEERDREIGTERPDRGGHLRAGAIAEVEIEERAPASGEVGGAGGGHRVARDRGEADRGRTFGDDIADERGIVDDEDLLGGWGDQASLLPTPDQDEDTPFVANPGTKRLMPPSAPRLKREDVRALYDRPLLSLVDEARRVHLAHHAADAVQLCTLLSVKTGGCPEDCAYCPQSSHYTTDVGSEKMIDVEDVLRSARRARDLGATRFCMGAAWREVKDGPAFDKVLEMVRGVKDLGLEACTTLGMLTDSQATRLKDAGLDAYNHNIDTSPEHYRSIISTRTFDERIKTIERVRRAGITVCSGGIIGMGETVDDRCQMLRTLANLDPQPESVPINALVAVSGTPLEGRPPVDPLEMVRMIATARILMPRARVRLSAGRTALSREAQILCMLAGANSIFYGEKLLTTPNPGEDEDLALLRDAGISPLPLSS
jgi:biotin synthase